MSATGQWPTDVNSRARGAMDNASDYGSEDSRFESWRARACVCPLFLNIHEDVSSDTLGWFVKLEPLKQ